jgi:hypothetical protein
VHTPDCNRSKRIFDLKNRLVITDEAISDLFSLLFWLFNALFHSCTFAHRILLLFMVELIITKLSYRDEFNVKDEVGVRGNVR